MGYVPGFILSEQKGNCNLGVYQGLCPDTSTDRVRHIAIIQSVSCVSIKALVMQRHITMGRPHNSNVRQSFAQ